MAIEQRRGCGFRKVGGLYLVGSGTGMPCCKLPIPLVVCPTCHGGIKQTRGFTWIDPQPWLVNKCTATDNRRVLCPAVDPAFLGAHVGLLWIGAKFYPTPEHFMVEARAQGISRRISALPRKFVLGTTWVFLAHPLAARQEDGTMGPGVFHIFCPRRVEKLVTVSQAADTPEMEKLEKAGITPVIVPDDDRDHQGTVYDDDAEETLPLPLEEVT